VVDVNPQAKDGSPSQHQAGSNGAERAGTRCPHSQAVAGTQHETEESDAG